LIQTKRKLIRNLARILQNGKLEVILVLNKGYAENLKKLGSNTKAFNFTSPEDDFRPTSKESDSRTSTSTPFNKIRNNLNSDILKINPQVQQFLSDLKLIKYEQLFAQNGIESMTSVLELNEEFLGELEIPLGHKLKIIK